MIEAIVDVYKKWKIDNPDRNYQYDEIFEFIAGFSRGEMQGMFEYLEEKLKSHNKDYASVLELLEKYQDKKKWHPSMMYFSEWLEERLNSQK